MTTIRTLEDVAALLQQQFGNQPIVTPTATGVQIKTDQGTFNYPFRPTVRRKDRSL